MVVQNQKNTTVNQGCMPLLTCYLKYGRHVGQLRRHRCRRAYAPTSNTASQGNHAIQSFLYEYGALLGGPARRWSSAITLSSYFLLYHYYRAERIRINNLKILHINLQLTLTPSFLTASRDSVARSVMVAMLSKGFL